MLKAFLIAALLALPILHAQGGGGVKGQLNELLKREGPKVGEQAPDFSLEAVTGAKKLRASELWMQKPMVLTTGSYTCPGFREGTPAQHALLKEFGDRVNFVLVYTIEAHPVGSACPYIPQQEIVTPENYRNGILLLQPPTYEARKESARKCREEMRLKWSMVVDTIDDATWRAYGRSPNCGYLIGKDGRVVLQQGLFDADEMRKAILLLLGEANATAKAR